MEKNTNNSIGDFFMKKYLIIILVILLFIIIIPKPEENLRIRVIANSNSNEDQNLKMKVVNVIKSKINTYDSEDMVNEVRNNLDEIELVVEEVLKDKQYTVAFKKMRFPPKELNGEIIKGGKYLTLVVIIEEGEGKNWWSLLSPNFNGGFEDNETDDVEFKSFFYEELKKCFR